jgi:hypothetical protein
VCVLWSFTGTNWPIGMENPMSTSESPVLSWMSACVRGGALADCWVGRATIREENKIVDMRMDFILP